MPFEITKAPDIPMVIAKLFGHGNRQSIDNLFAQAVSLVDEIRGPSCMVIDLHIALSVDIGAFVDAARLYKQRILTTKSDGPMFEAIIGKGDILAQLPQSLDQAGIVMPIFQNGEEAITYLSLKIDTENLTQAVKRKDTRIFSDEKLNNSLQIDQDTTTRVSEAGEYFPEHGVLQLKSEERQKVIRVYLDGDLLIGRRDSMYSSPEVDFSLWGGYQLGISRRHAKISLSARKTLQLTDLGSANGTYISGKRLEPFVPYPLLDGDQVAFGRLSLEISFRDGPKTQLRSN